MATWSDRPALSCDFFHPAQPTSGPQHCCSHAVAAVGNMGNTWAWLAWLAWLVCIPGGSRLWTIRLLHPYSYPASTAGVHGPAAAAAAQRSGRWVGAEPTPLPSHSHSHLWSMAREEQRGRGGGVHGQHGYNTPQPSHHHLFYEKAHPPSPHPSLTLSPLLFFLFAVVGVHANSLVLGPSDSVTLLTLFLIYYSFPPSSSPPPLRSSSTTLP